MMLVPSIMQLLGRANCWLPAWMQRLLPGAAPKIPQAGAAAL
jgi:uncharacterized membrane protein YdfJ with MMPL/SSD domain